MHRYLVGWLVGILLGSLAAIATADDVVSEVSRSPFGSARSVAVDSRDGSCWVISGSSVLRLAADGSLLQQFDQFLEPTQVALDSRDGSCWVTDYWHSQIVHLATDGTERYRGGSYFGPNAIAVNSTDGSVWIGCDDNSVTHVDADGDEICRVEGFSSPVSLSVNPLDGSCWVGSLGDPEGGSTSPTSGLVHLSADGNILWNRRYDNIYGETHIRGVAVDPRNGSGWVSTGQQVRHLDADGNTLLTIDNYGTAIAVDAVNGSCWYLGSMSETVYAQVLYHITSSGDPISTTGQYGQIGGEELSVNSTDHSCTIAAWNGFLKYATDGILQWQQGNSHAAALAVDPVDGSMWWGGWKADVTAPYWEGWLARADASGEEQWKQVWDYMDSPTSLLIEPSDQSCWMANGGVARYAPDGTLLLPGETGPYNAATLLARDPRDGSLWTIEVDELGSIPHQPMHLTPDGGVLWSGPYGRLYDLAVSPLDGSVWVIGNDLSSGQWFTAHHAVDGRLLWRGVFWNPTSISLDPKDGSVWIAEAYSDPVLTVRRITHLSADHTILWEGGEEYWAEKVAVNPIDSSVWVMSRWSTVVHLLSSNGIEVGNSGEAVMSAVSSVTVDPRDGSLWVIDSDEFSTLQVNHFTVLLPFSDVPVNSWAKLAIRACTDAGIIQGYTSNTYRPTQPVTRAQLAVYLARALAGGETAIPDGPHVPSFGDVPPFHWAYKYIEFCFAQHVVQGSVRGYHPDDVVTRDQTAVFMGRAVSPYAERPDLPSYTPPTTPSFVDVPTDQWAYKYIEYCSANGIVQGYWDGYHPERVVTRDQVAVFIACAFGLL